ncbi:MAG: Fic family protein [Desulfovibrio sp.]|jgi:Fic family protein|nr:Fic family protein [Desulfovibrio sp.]
MSIVRNIDILGILREEQEMRLRGGLYHQTQIKLCYNSNRIEGSRLSEEQTRHIFETNTLSVEPGESADVDDIIETVNHFACFDYMLTVADAVLTEEIIKEFHRLLKSNTSDAKKTWFKVGAYKTRPNMVGDTKTTAPGKVQKAMRDLLAEYTKKSTLTFEDIVGFHHRFEAIHPFQDGNGRVGRMILFKECLRGGIVPFIIDEEHKLFYYRGLKEFAETPGYLLDTCRSAQDAYKKLLAYFREVGS